MENRHPGWELPYIGAGILVVSLRGVNFGFSVSLGVFWTKTPVYLAVKVSIRAACEEIEKIMYFQFVLFTRYM